MLRFISAVALVVAAGTPALADSYWEVEAARANARAGGPTNARDAELLDRYGCLSGTRSSFCEARERRYSGRRHRDRRWR
jgi:hypothetical protein